MSNRVLLRSMVFCIVCLFPIAVESLLAAGGTTVVATKGQATHVNSSWPKGVGELVNDSLRTTGWNSWFTEWPNDVNQYAFEVSSTAEINRLLEKLASVEADKLQVRFSHLSEPKSLGWVTNLPKGNGIPIVFSIGDQEQIDQWYKRTRNPFGVMEFISAPVAVPPTLTIFVQNKTVELKKLKIPDKVELSMGYLPTLFHKSNTKREKEKEEQGSSRKILPNLKNLDSSSRDTIQEIEEFLKSKNKSDS